MEWNPEDKKLMISTLKTSLPALLLVLLLWGASFLLSFIYLIIIVVIIIIGAEIYNANKEERNIKYTNIIKGLAYLAAILSLVFILNYFLGGNGFIALLLTVFSLSMIVLWRRRKAYMAWINHIEHKLYGMSLEEYKRGKKHEHKNRKR